MTAQWVLSGATGGGSVYALDITVPTGSTQVIFATSFPEGISALTQANADAAAAALKAAAAAMPGAACVLTPVTFSGMMVAQFPGAIPAQLTFPVSQWANYLAGFGSLPADTAQAALGFRVTSSAGMFTRFPADGVLGAASADPLITAITAALTALPSVAGPVSFTLQSIAPASVI